MTESVKIGFGSGWFADCFAALKARAIIAWGKAHHQEKIIQRALAVLEDDYDLTE